MGKSKHIILGGGMVAGYAAKEFVEHGLKAGELTIVSADTALPYERPPLSKTYLAGSDTEDSILINKDDFYKEHGIDVRLHTEVSGLDADRKVLRLKSGEELDFGNLVIATGATPRTLDVPGSEKLFGVFYLRSMSDSKQIRTHAANSKRAVVIGGGFIGMEVASVLAKQKIETTMIVREERIGPKFFAPSMSRYFEKYFSDHGVRFLKQTGVKELRGHRNVEAAVLEDGQSVACDTVVAGIGVKPVVDVLTGSGVETGDGVIVNEFLETNKAGIYAAGDVANYPDSIFGTRRRVEHWDNAVEQGKHVARILSGKREPFVHVPYFFSDVFDLSYEFWGDTLGATGTIERGDLSSGKSFSVWWVKDRRLVAAFVMNRPDKERESAPGWIAEKKIFSDSDLD
jgi:NADPH-dependent 2,4-dienoyl-CoA reductase/sulfur reductase-like enzyme